MGDFTPLFNPSPCDWGYSHHKAYGYSTGQICGGNFHQIFMLNFHQQLTVCESYTTLQNLLAQVQVLSFSYHKFHTDRLFKKDIFLSFVWPTLLSLCHFNYMTSVQLLLTTDLNIQFVKDWQPSISCWSFIKFISPGTDGCLPEQIWSIDFGNPIYHAARPQNVKIEFAIICSSSTFCQSGPYYYHKLVC